MGDPSLPSPPAPTVWPTVGFTDVDAGVRFLAEGLGFVVTAMHRGDHGTVQHAEARWPDGGGVMFSARDRPGPWGSHEFDLRDADGNLWCVGTYRGA